MYRALGPTQNYADMTTTAAVTASMPGNVLKLIVENAAYSLDHEARHLTDQAAGTGHQIAPDIPRATRKPGVDSKGVRVRGGVPGPIAAAGG